MIHTFKELQALESKEVFIERTYAGWVTFKLVECTDTSIVFKSTSISGFDFDFCGKFTIRDFEAYAQYRPICTSIEEARRYNTQRQEQVVSDYVNRYKDDKDAFIKDMIQTAYNAYAYAEYGDYDKAAAVEAVAGLFYPELDLEEGI